jgi:hypothetical protein
MAIKNDLIKTEGGVRKTIVWKEKIMILTTAMGGRYVKLATNK